MKRAVVGTRLGHYLQTARDIVASQLTMYRSPEAAGTVANDHLALSLVTRLCRAGRAFVDVGAHIGSVTAAVGRFCPASPIYAVEAVAEKAAFLQRKFPAVTVFNCAVGETEGMVPFFVNRVHSAESSLGRNRAADTDTYERTVVLKRLDDLLAGVDIDVVKVDVEGAELGVLRGSERIVGDLRPTIMFESGAPCEDGLGYSKGAMWEWLDAHGYGIVAPNRLAHDDPGMTLDVFLDSHLHPRRSTNYFAVASERRIEIRDKARQLLGIVPA